MKKRITALFMTVALIITMAIPTMAEFGENMGDDNFPINVVLDSLEGDYSLGEYKEITLDIWASGGAGSTVERRFEITGVGEGTDFSNLEFKDGETWKSINEYNGVIVLQNDVNRVVRVKFNTAGVYSVKLSLFTTSGEEIDFAERVVDVSDEGIKAYIEPETTTGAQATTNQETSTGPTICPTTPSVSETTVPAPSNVTTSSVEPTTAGTVKPAKPGKVTIKKVNSKKKSAKKVKLTLKKITGVDGYQVAVYKTKKNAKKDKKAVVKKFVKKTKITIKSNKLKNKKKLYVRARAYVSSGKAKTYGKWSKIKQVKIK